MVVISIYGVEIMLKFLWESGFLRGSMEPPLFTNRSVEYLYAVWSVLKETYKRHFTQHCKPCWLQAIAFFLPSHQN